MWCGERFVDVAGGQCLVAPALDHHLRDFADEHIVFDDQNHGHCQTSAVTRSSASV
jgi:hypothetical protein